MTARWFDELSVDARGYIDALHNCLALYLPSKHDQIEFMVGFKIKATLRIEGANLTKPLLAEIIASLHRYKKFYPEKIDPSETLTLENIMDDFERILADHRAAQAAIMVIKND